MGGREGGREGGCTISEVVGERGRGVVRGELYVSVCEKVLVSQGVSVE